MNSLESNDVVACPQCSAPLPTQAKFCWLCGVSLRPNVPNAAVPNTPESAPIIEPRAAYQFGISTLLLAMTMLAVLMGTFAIEPGIGLAVAFLATPPLIRTCIVATKRKTRGQAMSPLAKLGVFSSTLGIVIVVVAGSIGAFFAVCFTDYLLSGPKKYDGPRIETTLTGRLWNLDVNGDGADELLLIGDEKVQVGIFVTAGGDGRLLWSCEEGRRGSGQAWTTIPEMKLLAGGDGFGHDLPGAHRAETLEQNLPCGKDLRLLESL